MELEDLKKELDEFVKRKRDFSMSFTILDSQLSNGKNLLSQVQKENAELQERNQNLEKIFKEKFSEKIKDLDDRADKLRKEESEFTEKQNVFRQEQSLFRVEQDKLIEKNKAVDALNREYLSKIERLNSFLEDSKSFLHKLQNG